MAPPRTYRCEAIILGYTPLGEADLLVTMYTWDQGKVKAVGKGARRSTSKLVGHLEPLTMVRMSMAHGLEARLPYLDYRIVELASKLPSEYKVTFLQTKRILKTVS